MSYTALYRKWRPDTFEDVKGQDHIVQTLKNQIISQRVGHAYLFCGTRGTGKTSIAKIFAKAVNCENPIEGSPCNACTACRNVARQISLNVVEIDAASNNGVENIREIREQVQYPPTEGKYRIYIIDEVHMLSTGAFNALLKTLEEPPSYVIFILATTEVHKIPITVLSRCQRYDFKRITLEAIARQLREITAAEQVETEEKALRYVAKAADGSLRDALSLLDQCIAFHYGEVLTYDNVLEVLGAVDNSVFSNLFRAVLENRTTDCIYQLEEIVLQGRELGQFVTDFIWYLRNLLLLKTADDAENMLDISAEYLVLLKQEAAMTAGEMLMRYIRVFSELSNQLRYASQKRVLIELAVIKLTRPEMEANLDSIAARLNQIETRLAQGIPVQTSSPPAAVLTSAEPSEKKPEQIVIPQAQLSDLNMIQNDWSKIIGAMGRAARPSLSETVLEPGGDGCLCIVFTTQSNFSIGSRQSTLEELEEYVASHYGKTMHFKVRVKNSGENLNHIYVSEEEIQAVIHDEIIYED